MGFEHLPAVPATDGHHEWFWEQDDWGNLFGEGYAASEPIFRTATPPTSPGFTAPLAPTDIAEVTHIWAVGYQDYADQTMVAVMRLHDGRWACVETWSDSSGYGCRDGTDWHIGDSLQDVVLWGLTDEGRERLGLG